VEKFYSSVIISMIYLITYKHTHTGWLLTR
jgi:hypothetical protein